MNQIIVDVGSEEIWIALLEDKELAEFYVERKGRERTVGNIYKGKVSNVVPGMQAAFIDIGLEKNAFLYVNDILVDKSDFEFDELKYNFDDSLRNITIRDILQEGQEITVQVVKEPIGTKGARVTTHITLPGRICVLMPTVNYIGVSRRIETEKERARLRAVAEKVKPRDMGLIIRTAAEGKEYQDFVEEIDFLIRLWNKIKRKDKIVSAPRLIYKDENLIYRTVRDMFTTDIDRFIINDKEQYHKVIEMLDLLSPKLKSRVQLYDKDTDISDYFQLETKIEKALCRKVWLKSGGYLVFDHTEAFTSIDVNTGRYVGGNGLQDTVLHTNLEAAKEIARQLRLRDIGGIIIIDFIDMEEESHKQMVLDCLKQALKKDRTKTNVLGMTNLGLVEMTRKKVKQRISSILQKPCPYCQGTGRVFSEETTAAKVRRELEKTLVHTESFGILVEVYPGVAEKLRCCSENSLGDYEHKFGRKIYVRECGHFHIEQFRIKPVGRQDSIDEMLTKNATFS
ncbi:MAG: Rne/Rng family ribonuclease [Clostridia bacterium]|jgi:ribonuclease G